MGIRICIRCIWMSGNNPQRDTCAAEHNLPTRSNGYWGHGFHEGLRHKDEDLGHQHAAPATPRMHGGSLQRLRYPHNHTRAFHILGH